MSDAALQDHRGRPTVAVTGLGVVSPAGSDREGFWSTLVGGRSAATTVEEFVEAGLPVQFGCPVTDLDPSRYVDAKAARRLDRATLLGVAAASDAVDDAGGNEGLDADPARCSVIAGTGVGGLDTLVSQQDVYSSRGHQRVSPFFVPMMMPNATAAHLSMRLGWTGRSLCVATACAAGANAIGEAVDLVRSGSADVVVAGGTEAAMVPVAVAAFWRMGALSTRNDEPALASRPFDVDRDGFVMGEGAAFLVLERLDRARARGARIHGVVAGYGANADAHHITAPVPGGEGAAACMAAALEDAALDPSEVGHVNTHGTSTPLNDAAESAAVTKVFGSGAPPVTSVKGVTGHLVGAAGAVEAVASLLAMERGLVPPVANHEQTDPEIGLDVVAGDAREVGAAPVVSNSFGFGGHNATLVLTPAP